MTSRATLPANSTVTATENKPRSPRDTTNYLALLAANTILGLAMPMLILMGSLAGSLLSPIASMATLPPSIQTFAGLLATAPFSLLMGRLGRRVGFFIAGMLAIIGAAIGVAAMMTASFWLLCLSHAAMGAALAGYLYFRFAAAEVVPERWQAVAISIMLTSGLIAALLGPELFIHSRNWLHPTPLAGAYAAVIGITLVGVLPLLLLRLPPMRAQAQHQRWQWADLRQLLQRPAVRTAVVSGSIAQGVMVLLMVPTPLAMNFCGYSEAMAGDVIRWHVVAMFAPSFVTGLLIRRFGTLTIAVCGHTLLLMAALLAASGVTPTTFYSALIVLGIGWNFAFIAATHQLTAAVNANERAVSQGVNDTLIALASTLCALSSGTIVSTIGWLGVSLTALPLIAIALIVLIVFRER